MQGRWPFAQEVFTPGVAVAVFVTSWPAKVAATLALIVNVTEPRGAITSVTPIGKPVPCGGVAVVPAPVVTVLQVAAVASICAGTGSSKVACAIVDGLGLVTTTV